MLSFLKPQAGSSRAGQPMRFSMAVVNETEPLQRWGGRGMVHSTGRVHLPAVTLLLAC